MKIEFTKNQLTNLATKKDVDSLISSMRKQLLNENFKSLEDKINAFSSSFKDFFRSSSNDIIDLLIDDLSILPSKSEVDQYLDEVDSLKSRTDQLYKKYKNAK